jgi:hypothetical protein
VNNELERLLKEAIVAVLMYYAGICLEGLKKTSRSADMNPGLPEYEAEFSHSTTTSSVIRNSR